MTKREELARALAEKRIPGVPLTDEARESFIQRNMYAARLDVDTLLAALMEPSEEMIEAACETEGMKQVDNIITFAFVHGHKITSSEPPLVQAWQAMLKAIKDEGDT